MTAVPDASRRRILHHRTWHRSADRAEKEVLEVGNEVEIVGLTEEKRKVVATGVEMFRKLL